MIGIGGRRQRGPERRRRCRRGGTRRRPRRRPSRDGEAPSRDDVPARSRTAVPGSRLAAARPRPRRARRRSARSGTASRRRSAPRPCRWRRHVRARLPAARGGPGQRDGAAGGVGPGERLHPLERRGDQPAIAEGALSSIDEVAEARRPHADTGAGATKTPRPLASARPSWRARASSATTTAGGSSPAAAGATSARRSASAKSIAGQQVLDGGRVGAAPPRIDPPGGVLSLRLSGQRERRLAGAGDGDALDGAAIEAGDQSRASRRAVRLGWAYAGRGSGTRPAAARRAPSA